MNEVGIVKTLLDKYMELDKPMKWIIRFIMFSIAIAIFCYPTVQIINAFKTPLVVHDTTIIRRIDTLVVNKPNETHTEIDRVDGTVLIGH